MRVSIQLDKADYKNMAKTLPAVITSGDTATAAGLPFFKRAAVKVSTTAFRLLPKRMKDAKLAKEINRRKATIVETGNRLLTENALPLAITNVTAHQNGCVEFLVNIQ